MISGWQIREALHMLGWNRETLRPRANLPDQTVGRAELAEGTPSVTLHQAGLIQQALERVGIHFGQNGAVLRMAPEENP